MVSFLTKLILVAVPTGAFVYAPDTATTSRARGGFDGARRMPRSAGVDGSAIKNQQNNDDADDLFDPFLQSPLSFGPGDGPVDAVPVVVGAGDDVVVANDAPAPPSPSSGGDDFDPLLSPHAYADGVDAAPVATTPEPSGRLGVLIIDHGSRRAASNDHLRTVAIAYEEKLNRGRGAGNRAVVRAAHMEIAPPSIADAMRHLVVADGATRVVCVPYFLGPGRHSEEDVPALVEGARGELAKGGFEGVEVVVSDALGTRMESMLGAVDDLVGRVISDDRGK